MRVLLAGPDFEENLSIRIWRLHLRRRSTSRYWPCSTRRKTWKRSPNSGRGGDCRTVGLFSIARAGISHFGATDQATPPGKTDCGWRALRFVRGAGAAGAPSRTGYPGDSRVGAHAGGNRARSRNESERRIARRFRESRIEKTIRSDSPKNAARWTIWTLFRFRCVTDASTPSRECRPAF